MELTAILFFSVLMDIGVAVVPIHHRAQAKGHSNGDPRERHSCTVDVETVLLEYDRKRFQGQVRYAENLQIPASMSAAR